MKYDFGRHIKHCHHSHHHCHSKHGSMSHSFVSNKIRNNYLIEFISQICNDYYIYNDSNDKYKSLQVHKVSKSSRKPNKQTDNEKKEENSQMQLISCDIDWMRVIIDWNYSIIWGICIIFVICIVVYR